MRPVRRLTLMPMIAFGVGQTAEGIKNSAFNTFVLFFYQQVVGVSGLLTGIALGIALVFDAVSDPIAGTISDKTQTRWGRRHPFMLVAAIPLALSFYLLFNPPRDVSEITSFLWLTVFAILVRGSLTFYYIPHLALGAEMARDYNQRSTLFAFSTLFGAMGGAFTGFFAYRLFFPTTPEFSPGLLNPDGYVGFGATFAIAMAVAIVSCCIGTAKEIPYLPKPLVLERFGIIKLVRELRAVFGNKSFRALFFGMLFSTLVLSIEAVFSPFMGVHFLGPHDRTALGAAIGGNGRAAVVSAADSADHAAARQKARGADSCRHRHHQRQRADRVAFARPTVVSSKRVAADLAVGCARHIRWLADWTGDLFQPQFDVRRHRRRA